MGSSHQRRLQTSASLGRWPSHRHKRSHRASTSSKPRTSYLRSTIRPHLPTSLPQAPLYRKTSNHRATSCRTPRHHRCRPHLLFILRRTASKFSTRSEVTSRLDTTSLFIRITTACLSSPKSTWRACATTTPTSARTSRWSYPISLMTMLRVHMARRWRKSSSPRGWKARSRWPGTREPRGETKMVEKTRKDRREEARGGWLLFKTSSFTTGSKYRMMAPKATI